MKEKVSILSQTVLNVFYLYEMGVLSPENTEGIVKEFDVIVYKELINLKLLKLDVDDIVPSITEAGRKLVTGGGYVVKYPLHDQHGNVKNYNKVLESMNKNAAKALGSSILTTEFYKKWGKSNNIELKSAIEDSIKFYRDKEHPISKINNYLLDIQKADGAYQLMLRQEMSKIDTFVLPKRLKLGTYDNETVYLLGINNEEYKYLIVSQEGKKEIVGDPWSRDIKFYIPTFLQKSILENYYKFKSSVKPK